MFRLWAFWRRVQYAVLTFVVFLLISTGVYYGFFYQAPTCFDGVQNGDERGVDCGGACQRICESDVIKPTVEWSRSFKITKGFYNAVAYVTNTNKDFGTKELSYTFTLVDKAGATITTRSGSTFLPPDSEYPIFEGRIQTGDREVAQTFITLAPITNWQIFDSARDQFTVNSRALKDVDSKPRLDASLTNTSLADSRDVEIVATIFDSKGNALTASETVVPLFEGRAQKNVVFTWPEPIAKTIRSCEVPTDVILAIDLSGSMNNDGGNPPEPVTSALKAAQSFVGRLRKLDQIGIVTFATKADLVRTLSGDKTTAGKTVGALTIDPKEEHGSTNMGDALTAALNEFMTPRHSLDARKVLVAFTDGKSNAPDPDPEGYALSAAAKVKDQDIDVFTIGLGADVNQAFLTSVASAPEKRYLAANAGALDTIYRNISTAICEDGAARIDIVPKIIGGLNDNK